MESSKYCKKYGKFQNIKNKNKWKVPNIKK
jgi:hypothetical protein